MASTNNDGSCLVMPSGGLEEHYSFVNESREASLALLSGEPEMPHFVRHDTCKSLGLQLRPDCMESLAVYWISGAGEGAAQT